MGFCGQIQLSLLKLSRLVEVCVTGFVMLWCYTMQEDQVGGISEIWRLLYVLLEYAYSQNSSFLVLCYICGFCLVTWQWWICQSSLDIPVVSKSTDEKLFLEQAGSLCASLPLLLCFDVLGVNVSESKRSILIQGGARSRKKHALLHIPKEWIQRCQYSISTALPGVAESESKRTEAMLKCDLFF